MVFAHGILVTMTKESPLERLYDEFTERPWQIDKSAAPASFEPSAILLGQGSPMFEVAIGSIRTRPSSADVERLWRDRWGKRANPVLLVIEYGTETAARAVVCGLRDGAKPVFDVELEVVLRSIAEALRADTASEAERTIAPLFVATDSTELAGVRNEGLFSLHELKRGVPEMTEWNWAREQGERSTPSSGRALLDELGWTSEPVGSTGLLLKSGLATWSAAVILDGQETPERPATRFGGLTPVEQGLALARRASVKWLVLIQGSRMRLYAASPESSTVARGDGDAYFEATVSSLTDETLPYLYLIFSPRALENGIVESIVRNSREHASDLGTRLRERIYLDVVPKLARVIAERMKAQSRDELDQAYHHSLVVLFRLLFVAYAEDSDLLPYRSNEQYARRSLKTAASDLSSEVADFDSSSDSRWVELTAVWKAVESGNRDWGIPAYNGGLFASDGPEGSSGPFLAGLRLANDEIGPILAALLVDVGTDNVRGPVDFRSLSVREFGTIYEGLLESSLSIAPRDLVVETKDTKTKGSYRPVKRSEVPDVKAGEVYLHNASGARKATGSYFTKAFAVDHLLDSALEPALTEHLARVAILVRGGDDAGAAKAFFDFRVVDLAMGSGHFLVAAIDRIAAQFSKFLAEHPIPAIQAELNHLQDVADAELGNLGRSEEIERSRLLRRQIARRCVYGADINQIAVELARLAMWIHTFVPGLSMASLNHGLVHGNSLTGIASVDEALQILDGKSSQGSRSLYSGSIEDSLTNAADLLTRVATTVEATATDSKANAAVYADAKREAAPAAALLDAALAGRLGLITPQSFFDTDDLAAAVEAGPIREQLDALQPLHYPVAFPEVFLRDRPGFDVVLGNPPWEEVTVEKLGYYSKFQPGLKSLKGQKQKDAILELEETRPDIREQYEVSLAAAIPLRHALLSGQYPGMGTGDPDLYKAFAWRSWSLLKEDGRLGIVLPRTALSASGSELWRKDVLANGSFESVSVLTNNRTWIFEQVHPQYTIGLIVIRKGSQYAGSLRLNGPFASLDEYKQKREAFTNIDTATFSSWTDEASFPMVPTPRALDIYMTMRASPRLDSAVHPFKARPVSEFHATSDSREFSRDVDLRVGWPVYKGASFDLWEPDTGVYYGWANPDHVKTVLQDRRLRQMNNKRSAFSEMEPAIAKDPLTLPCLAPRVAFRDVSRATDTRTIRAALIPGDLVANNSAPYLLMIKGDESDEAFLLGVLCSVPFDWFARTIVESHISFFVLNALPVPDLAPGNPVRDRIVELAGRLAAIDQRYSSWAAEVGVGVGTVDTKAERDRLIAELDALVAFGFGVSRDQLEHIFETLHRGWDHQTSLDATLHYFDRLVKAHL